MSAYLIKGGRKLLGEIDVAGSKNASLAIMSAVVLAEAFVATVLGMIAGLKSRLRESSVNARRWRIKLDILAAIAEPGLRPDVA